MSTLFKFDTLSQEEAQFIIACVGEKPFNMVAGLIQKLGNQLNAQLNPPAPPVPLGVSQTTKLTDAVKGLPETLDMPAPTKTPEPQAVDALG